MRKEHAIPCESHIQANSTSDVMGRYYFSIRATVSLHVLEELRVEVRASIFEPNAYLCIP
jgi:hypothetical protein